MSTGEINWFDTGYWLLGSNCECDIDPAGCISHEVSYAYLKYWQYVTIKLNSVKFKEYPAHFKVITVGYLL